MDNVKIIAVVGMSGSGKSTAVDYLTEKSYPKVYFGGMILKEMERRGIEITPDSEREFRELIRREEGTDWVVRQAIRSVYDLVEAGQKRIILDGVYTFSEYKILKREFPGKLTFVGIVVDKDLRFRRVAIRPERPFDTKELQERDWSEVENLEKGGPIAMADYYILNNGSIKDLHERLEEILEKIDFAL